MTEGQCLMQSTLLETNPVIAVSAGLLLTYLIVSKLQDFHVLYQLKLLVEFLRPVPLIDVEMTAAESRDDGVDTTEKKKGPAIQDPKEPGFIQCFDPSTGDYLGKVPAMTPADVHEACIKASKAQKSWSQTTFAQRRMVLRTLQKYIVNHVRDICRVSSRDSGKPVVDALLGEVLTTSEKIRCINAWGELWLRPQYRPTGPLMMHKTAAVEYVPLGIVAPIAPWNYP